ncbi:MAG: Fic family protein [Candidatus Moranbacteria bacterium GW2011_GWA2_39_41]|nr:MAG: Fic family protein [Candidatus Moranbacteria bacterium GW2011_GWA2_39_41]
MSRLAKRLLFDQKQSAEIYNLIAKIDIVKGQWKLSEKLSPQMIARLKTSVLITSSGASTRIEGAKLSDAQVKKLYENMHIQKFKNRDEQEVAGYLELLKKVFDSWRKLSFSENLIKNFHQEIMKYSEKDTRHRGQYKFGSNRVEAIDRAGKVVGVIFDPTPPHLVSKEMLELTDWTKKELASTNALPLLLIANFIFEFLAIHPFQDGNGRTSRVLTNFLLLKAGYEFVPYISHESLVENNKADYYLALNKTQKTWKKKTENITPWIIFFLKTVLKQAELSLKLLTEEQVEDFLSEKQLQIWQFALSQKTFARADAIKGTKLNTRTIEESIKKLLRMNKLKKIGEGKATRYEVIL